MATENLTIAQVTVSPTYIRGMTDEAHVERMEDVFRIHDNRWPSTMPPIDVAPLSDKDPAHLKLIKAGFTHEILDGVHRYTGAARAGMKEIPCQILNLPPVDRILHQIKATAGHAVLPFTREARNRAVLYLVKVAKMSREKVGELMRMHRSSVSRIASGETGIEHKSKGKKGKKGTKRTGSVQFATWLAAGLAFCKKGGSAVKGFIAKEEGGEGQVKTLAEGLLAFVE